MARGRPTTGKRTGKGAKLHKTTAWLWAETTAPHKVTQKNVDVAYRIGMNACERGSCRINCKFNPNCLNGLGEKLWLGEVQDNYWHTLQDPEAERRKEDEFVGLKNLGATCYVNTFLQLWFHNTSLRSAIYHWKDIDADQLLTSTDDAPQDEKPMADNLEEAKHEISLKPENKLPPLMPSSCISDDNITNICAHLQLIFAQLQYTSRRYIDPTPLIHSLGLDTAQQQDAQEFSKLFMSLLESTLSVQPDPDVRDVIQKQFGGEYVYVTKCDNCGNKSMTLSQFFELDLNIQGHSSLSQCIKEFLKEEELNGDNQYFCMACNSKQNAKRYIEIQSLPPVLNLQLLRFVFDRKTGYKKKLNSHVQFPNVLSLDGFLRNDVKKEASNAVYELTAVLMHQGTSAYSGHYIAHIRDTKADTWYKFNDEEIEKMNNKLKLSGEDESDPGEKPAKRPKCIKGYHTSRNAYMLVYSRKTNDTVETHDDVDVPGHLQEMVAKDNSKFEQWIDKMNKMKDDMINKGKNLQASVQSIYQMLPVKPRENYEWISTEWLRTWLNDRVESKPPVDNSSLLCPHGKLHPEKSQHAKRISVHAADCFYGQYGGFPRLKSDSMCLHCVKSICRQIRFKAKLAEDDKLIKTNLKNKTDSSIGRSYWIGKTSLQSWKRLATIEEEANNPQVTIATITNNCAAKKQQPSSNAVDNEMTDVNHLGSECRKRKNMSTTDEISNSEEMNLSPSVSNGTQISSKDSPSMVDSSGLDDSSKLNESDEEEEEDLIKFNEDLLCIHNNLAPSASCRRLIPESTWKRMKYYFSAPPEFPENFPVCKQCQVENEDERKNLEINKTVAVEEKSLLSNLYHNKHRPNLDDKDIPNITLHVISNSFLDKWRSFIRRYRATGMSRPESVSNQSLICPHNKLLFKPSLTSEEGPQEEYSFIPREEWDLITARYPYDHVITVTKETAHDGECRLTSTPEICEECHALRMLEKARSIETYRHATIFVRKITDEHDPEEIQRRFDEETVDPDSSQDLDYNSSDSKKQSSTSDVSKRRSSRHRKQRGEVDLTVSSNQTLRDIKLELMKSFSVMPMDQHLSLKGTPLSDDAATLSTLGVRPGCLLMLKLDQPQGGSHPETLLAASTAPEKGFQGTGLLGH